MSLIRYEPYDMMNRLQREMNRWFETNATRDEETGGVFASDWTPAVDIKEEENQFVIHADVPGIDPKEIDVTLENSVLTIRGQRVHTDDQEGQGYRRVERARGTFLRRFTLPETADADKVSAKTKDGVLEVVVPKGERAQPRRVTVEGS